MTYSILAAGWAPGGLRLIRSELQKDCLATADMVGENPRMADVGLVVLDEVHYLGDEDRGSVWEEVIISCPKRIPLLCMSATVRNPEDLGGWISKVINNLLPVT